MFSLRSKVIRVVKALLDLFGFKRTVLIDGVPIHIDHTHLMPEYRIGLIGSIPTDSRRVSSEQ